MIITPTNREETIRLLEEVQQKILVAQANYYQKISQDLQKKSQSSWWKLLHLRITPLSQQEADEQARVEFYWREPVPGEYTLAVVQNALNFLRSFPKIQIKFSEFEWRHIMAWVEK